MATGLEKVRFHSNPKERQHQRTTQKEFHDPDKHSGMMILECEIKWASDSITTNTASGGDGIPVELFQVLKDDAVKVLHSICQQTWKNQQ